MSTRLNCHCDGTAGCKLCSGKGTYQYQPCDMGWMPFPCPTCDASGQVQDEAGQMLTCRTCRGQKMVDPGDAPVKGTWNTLWKILMGA